MRNGPVEDEAIVLRNIKLGETSKIVSALSRHHGKVKLVAKGARRPDNRLACLLEPGNELVVQIYARPDRELWILAEASLLRAALTGAGSLDKLSHLFAALELADRLLAEREPLPEIEAVFRSFMDGWHREGSRAMAALFFALEGRLLAGLGLGLHLDECGGCGRPLSEAPRIAYRADDGVLFCGDCGAGSSRWMSDECFARWAELEACLNGPPVPVLGEADRRSIGRILHEHMTYHLPSYRVPRALYWLTDRDGHEKGKHR